MEIVSRWYFTKEVLENTPTRKCGIEASKELSYRQQAANFIQDMGQRLQVTQLCINTAIVYMHRFYMFHSFTKLHRNQLAVAALFLAAKVEEQPRKLEHVVRVAHKCLHRGEDLDPKSEAFMSKCSDLVSQENMMLQTLGFDIAIDHPHTYVVKLLQLVKASKDLAQTSYFMATNSLHLTTMCLQYRPTVVACVCIHLACKWSDWKIEPCSEGKEWYYYVDKSVTPELLEELTKDFLAVLEKSPNRLKRRVGPDNNNKDGQLSQSKCHEETAGRVDSHMYDSCMEAFKKEMSPLASTSSGPYDKFIKEEVHAKFAEPVNVGVDSTSQLATLKKIKTEPPHSISLAVYREKREKERLSEQKPSHSAPIPVSLNDFTPAQASNVTAPPKFNTSVKLEKNAVPIDDKRLVPLLPNHEKLVVSVMPNQEKLSNPDKLLGLNLEKPIVPSQEKLIVPKQEKIIVSGHEKRLPHKPVATSIELVPQRMPEKNSHKSITSTSVSDAISVDKVNHVIPKAMVAPMPQVNHQIPKVPVVPSAVKNIVQPKNDLSKITSEALKTNDPFVLLTRVDQTQIEKVSDSKGGQRTGVPPVSSKSLAPSRSDELRNKSRHPPTDPSCALTNWGKEVKNSENPSSVKLKAKVNVLQNNHNDLQHSTQGSIVKHSPSWDIAKANGSKVLEQPVAELPSSYTMEPPKPVEKTVEVHNKHERREKHKHKHSVHSNKDKATNHVSESTSDQGMPSGLKITIPKEKLVLSGIRTDINPKSSALVKEESSRTTLKIKIPRPKPPVPESPSTGGAKANSTGPSLKLVITKDKNAGSYSASRKAERASRKRDRSPSSKVHNSRSSGKGGKFPKVDGVANASLPDPDNAARVNTMKQSNLDMVYNNLAQQPYMMPYNSQPYFQQFCPYPIPSTNVQYGYPPLPPQPHSTNSVPPLPRDPPPPLPPQPPMTSE